MSRSIDEICRDMMASRRELTSNVRGVKGSARSLLDWRRFVARHPLACLGGVSMLGMLLAPRSEKGRATVIGAKTTAELAPNGNLAIGASPSRWAAITPLVATMGPPLMRIALGVLASHWMSGQSSSKADPVEHQGV